MFREMDLVKMVFLCMDQRPASCIWLCLYVGYFVLRSVCFFFSHSFILCVCGALVLFSEMIRVYRKSISHTRSAGNGLGGRLSINHFLLQLLLLLFLFCFTHLYSYKFYFLKPFKFAVELFAKVLELFHIYSVRTNSIFIYIPRNMPIYDVQYYNTVSFLI